MIRYRRLISWLNYIAPRRCDYCRCAIFRPSLWTCAECTEVRCQAWYNADCPPVAGR